jgi:hypothetical protein
MIYPPRHALRGGLRLAVANSEAAGGGQVGECPTTSKQPRQPAVLHLPGRGGHIDGGLVMRAAVEGSPVVVSITFRTTAGQLQVVRACASFT